MRNQSLSSTVQDFEKPVGFNVYGGNAALRAERSVTKSNPVLVIEAARSTGKTDGGGILYDWPNKIVFQILPRELPALLCCLLGITGTFEAKMHGAKKDKQLRLECQAERAIYFLRMSAGNQHLAVPITADSVFTFASLATRILSEQSFTDPATCLTLLRATTGRLLHHSHTST